MNSLNKIKDLSIYADQIWIPNWFEWFNDTENGGFYERLDKNKQPLDHPKRLLSQCRQIIVYAQYLRNNNITSGKIWDKLHTAFDYVIQFHHNKTTGGFHFSIDKQNNISDTHYDLYAHAFVILMCREYFETTKNQEALDVGKSTLSFIHQHFRAPIGYHEALDENLTPIERQRRQNPHMHLLEACICMRETTQDSAYAETATEMIDLFFNHFLDPKTKTITEFFDNNLHPCPQEGHKIEAGHHAEWIWLLSEYQRVTKTQSDKIEDITNTLFGWIKTHGIDKEYGGVYNVQSPQGDIIDANKRIWAQFETLRACVVMSQKTSYKTAATEMGETLTETIKGNYIDLKTGPWNEILSQDLKSESDFLPATTPYHIYPILKNY